MSEKNPEWTEGKKFDAEKPRMDLISSIWIKGVAEVLTFGARKYAAHNWRKGIVQSRLLGAGLRHLFAFLQGEDFDPETGLCHLDHASCCLMFARELWETRPDLDDRWRINGGKTGDDLPQNQSVTLPEEVASEDPHVPDPTAGDLRYPGPTSQCIGAFRRLGTQEQKWLLERLTEIQSERD